MTTGELTKSAIEEIQYRFRGDVWRQNQISVRGRKFTGRVGLPDIIGHQIGTGRAIYCEVKNKGDKLSQEQIDFMNQSSKNGAICLVMSWSDGYFQIKQWTETK